MKNIITSKTIILPDWIDDEVGKETVLKSLNNRMDFVLWLARKNVTNKTGGPFAAAVFNDNTGELISVGVNVVLYNKCSTAHAEIVALMLAQERIGRSRLYSGTTIVSSAQPCAMCAGALLWSGVRSLVYGASKEDVESITKFDEGPIPHNWKTELEQRGIEVIDKVLHKEACEILKLYIDSGGELY